MQTVLYQHLENLRKTSRSRHLAKKIMFSESNWNIFVFLIIP